MSDEQAMYSRGKCALTTKNWTMTNGVTGGCTSFRIFLGKFFLDVFFFASKEAMAGEALGAVLPFLRTQMKLCGFPTHYNELFSNGASRVIER